MTIRETLGGELRVEEDTSLGGTELFGIINPKQPDESLVAWDTKENWTLLRILAAGANLLGDVEEYINDLRALAKAARRQQNRKPDLFWEDHLDLDTCDEALDLIERRLREAKGE